MRRIEMKLLQLDQIPNNLSGEDSPTEVHGCKKRVVCQGANERKSVAELKRIHSALLVQKVLESVLDIWNDATGDAKNVELSGWR